MLRLRGWAKSPPYGGGDGTVIKKEPLPTAEALFKEASVGVEPTIADLQSAALATWPRRL